MAKPALFGACLLPLAILVWRAVADALGANPVEEITHTTGIWTLRLLLVTLAVTPIRRLSGWNAIIRYRRMLGLFAFFYGSLHFSTYLVLDQFFAIDPILEDVTVRPFITAGFTAFVLMVPLAVTSTRGMIRRLGGRRWQALHRLVYVSAGAGVAHYFWLVKVDTTPPLVYGAVLLLLLGVRIGFWLRKAAPGRARRSTLVTGRETPAG